MTHMPVVGRSRNRSHRQGTPMQDRVRRRTVKRGMPLAVLIVAATFGCPAPAAHAVPAPDVEFIYDTTVRKQYSFANTADAISYAHGICDKITGGASYAQVIGDVKNDVRPNDEYSANYLISN